jgi:hypothetical protein
VPSYLSSMSTQTTKIPSCIEVALSGETLDVRLLQPTVWLILIAKLTSSLYASSNARGLYADGVFYLVKIYSDERFMLFDVRSTVQILRQAPIVFLSKYTSATLFECGQVFTFVMLTMPTALCALCWFIAPRNRRVWILFPLIATLTGFAATSIHAIGEAAIAAGYYWVLLFILLFRTHSPIWRALFLLLCIPAFWLHEGAFPLIAALALAMVVRTDATYPHDGLFVRISAVLLVGIFVYQVRWVIYPQSPEDRAGVVWGLTHFQFLFTGGHFNLQLITAMVAMVALSAVFYVSATLPPAKAVETNRIIVIAWTCFALTAAAAAIMIERSFSPLSHSLARYHPVLASAALGIITILLLRFRVPERSWMRPATIFILISLCAAQTVADVAATNRWNAYVVDLQTRLANGRGIIPWETTLHTINERADIGWRLMSVGWVAPFNSIVYAPKGVVNAIIAPPIGSPFQPLDLNRPESLPKLRGIIYAPALAGKS